MGKIRNLKKKFGSARSKKLTLEEEITAAETAQPSGRVKQRGSKQDEENYVDKKLSKHILESARKQQERLEEEFGTLAPSKAKTLPVKSRRHITSSDEEVSEEDDNAEENQFYENITVDPEDEKALQLFMKDEGEAGQTLADIIKEKITEKQTEIESRMSDTCTFTDIDPRVKTMYEGVRTFLSRYRSGKLPKAFKVIPSLSNWEEILYITEPDCWTAAAMYQATRIFTSNLNEKMAQRFFNLVLLPRVRDDIAEYKQLNVHLYKALGKALFKPGAFMKGILLPLCQSGNCTLREAIIIGSVLTKNSIPILHASAAMLKIAEMDYSGSNSIFLRVFFEKRYALPYRVIDASVYHFIRFQQDKRELPVLWHQAMLAFVQNYKEDISSEQKEAMLELLKVHRHHQITAEVRREIIFSKSRDVEVPLEKSLGDRLHLFDL